MGFNFQKIGPILNKYMDTDKMDIGRRITIVNPDGSEGETSPDVPLYRDVPCHISFRSADNADPRTLDVIPITIGIVIYCDTNIDLQNNDLVTARKLDNSGEVMETYQGVIGFPVMHQSRQSVLMEMKTL